VRVGEFSQGTWHLYRVQVGAGRLELGGGRVLGYDDVGDPQGRPVVYLHGTPDARTARHPDDSLAARLGVRLLAVDRPGFGETSPHPDRYRLGRDLVALLDHLDLAAATLLGWSSGALAALAAAPALHGRCRRMVLVGGLPPVEAYRAPGILDALAPARRSFAALGLEDDPAGVAAEMAPYVVPMPLTPDLARDHVLEGAGAVGRRELASVPGAVEALAAALQAGVAQGTTGIEHDLRHQLEPGLDLASMAVPVVLVHGEHDELAPPVVGTWLAARLPDALVEVVPAAGHHLIFPRWEQLLGRVAA
jgi:pimeloyl-ACP methyl ester carboxylesterase